MAPWDPNADDPDSAPIKEEIAPSVQKSATMLTSQTLDIPAVLEFGSKLLAASTASDLDKLVSAQDATKQLEFKSRSIRPRLGLMGPHVDDQLSRISKEMQLELPSKRTLKTTPKSETAAPALESAAGLSKRQLNQLRRKQKLDAKSHLGRVRGVVDLAVGKDEAMDDAVDVNIDKDAVFSLKREDVDESAQIVADFKGVKDIIPQKSLIQDSQEKTVSEWPFEKLCRVLLVDLLDPAWELRHGAAMGLREVLRSHGRGAARAAGRSRHENDAANAAWAEDLACHLCCVLVLDRFGDYISDNVVAPIRESVGQTLGALLVHVPKQTACGIYRLLHQMVLMERVWEVCHGGMIGLRYLVAVRGDLLTAEMLDGVLEAVIKGLGDVDDDVRAVSAATLIPIAKDVVEMRPDQLSPLIRIIWSCLSDLGDDLSASTGSMMDLLAALCAFPQVLEAMRRNAVEDSSSSFRQLVPRLYPFLRHTITSVRAAVLRALSTFLKITGQDQWADGHTLRLLFQNLFVERNAGNLELSMSVFLIVLDVVDDIEHAEDMLALALHPIGTPQNPFPVPLWRLVRPSGQLYGPPEGPGEPPPKRRKRVEVSSTTHDVDGPMIAGDVDLVGFETLIRSRIYTAVAFGKILNRYDGLTPTLVEASQSPYSTTQLAANMIIQESGGRKEALVPVLLRQIETEPPPYADTLPYLKVVRSQCQNLLNAFRDFGGLSASKLPSLAIIVQGEDGAGPAAFSLEDADKLVESDFERLKRTLSASNRLNAGKVLTDTRTAVLEVIERARTIKTEREMRIRAAAAAALVAMQEIPKKPSALIKGIMDSIKTEEVRDLQARSAESIASLLDWYSRSQKRGPADKIIANLASFYCMDTAETPEFSPKEDLILSLHKEEDHKDYLDSVAYEKEARAARCTRRGTKLALDRLCQQFGADLFVKTPVLRTKIEDPTEPQAVIDGLSILRALVPVLHPDLHAFVGELMPKITQILKSKTAVFRYAAAKCFATVCSVLQMQGICMLVEDVLPHASSDDLHYRQGVIELIYHLIHVMQDDILPFVIFLLVPVLGRMSDSDNEVRIIATTTFATLVKLVPLEAGIPDPEGFPQKLLEGREKERKFISQMLDPKKVESFELPVAIKAELRSYQQEGVNWLAFLNRYHLHGILCDDMGLGKTLQTLCIVASDHHLRAERFSQTGDSSMRRLPSLIVCPPTLSGHWQQEIAQFAPFLSYVAFVGNADARMQLADRLGETDIVITSYDVCRKEIERLTTISWNYCVLDEGHLIKNPRAKISIAVKRLASNHRLILSGTPIQNNVLELWSLFDFLMPGFLGVEKVFLDRVAKPIAASRNAKSSSKEQESGALAIEALHKQVLPFLLRRLKEEVLEDLPPKIIQNYYCDLSALQRRLFDDFSRKERQQLTQEVGVESKEAKQHIFQALQYMRKLCNSPALVMKQDHKHYASTQAMLKNDNSTLDDPIHAPKLIALRDLLVDCGIGVVESGGKAEEAALGPVSPHRALIFFQMKEMLDIVASTVLGKLLPSVQYLRLDGSVEAGKRQAIVNRFNTDPSYDVLLLTTSVGGLGLNLTGADTVIFVEHDWNPQKDMQAMDRAHRIGQKKVVNVYRLVTRGTLEEKILG